jgi:hemerythrin-like domain-containing protein
VAVPSNCPKETWRAARPTEEKGDAIMGPFDELRAEHEGILLMLRILDKVCERIATAENVDPLHFDQMMEFWVVFVDKCHHGKEEEFLFPALEAAGLPREGGPVGVMLREHVAGRTCVRHMNEALNQYRGGDALALRRFREHALQYIQLLRQHIDKENNVLFAMAEARLAKSQQDELANAFGKLERERIGEGKHEELHGVMERLQHAYLSRSNL